MDKVARFPAKHRKELFQESARKRGWNPAVIEKDFWVCLVLKWIFADPVLQTKFVFKGGTSLSKVFGLINRFSEDIDLVLDWGVLGYGSDKTDPFQEFDSNSQQDRFNKQINEKAAKYIEDVLLQDLKYLFGQFPGISISIDPSDTHTVNITYPATFAETYLRPEVRLEIGPLASRSPSDSHIIKPYAAEDFSTVFENPECRVIAINAERTFWEKATILHQQAHRTNAMPSRYSRHYYDLYMLSNSYVRDIAISNFELLEEVTEFKQRFYPCHWARYEDAKPGTFKLVPSDQHIVELRRDYRNMAMMIFGESPEFDQIIDALKKLELRINAIGSV